MGVLTALKNSIISFRASLSDPDPALRGLLGAPESSSGVEVNEFLSMNLAAVWSATRIYAETIPTLPLKVHEKVGNTRTELPSHYLSRLLASPNPDQVPFTYWETFVHHAILWGNGYASVERNRAGEPIGLHTLLPDRTRAERKDGIVRYITRQNNGQEKVMLPHEVFHVPGLSFDGLRGYSVITVARDSMGLGLAAQKFGSVFYKNGASLKGVLTTEGEFATDRDRKRFRESFESLHQGIDNAHLTPVLPKGMSYEKIGIPPDDAQFLETRLFQVREIARWFRLPPHLLADLADATFSNVEHQGQEFVTYSLMPWLVRIEQAISHRLLFEDEQGRLFAKHNVQSLLRGDLDSRFKAYSTGRQNGWLSANDVLALEDQNPIGAQGDTYMVQLNMQSAEDLIAGADDDLDGDDPNDDPDDDNGKRPIEKGKGEYDMPLRTKPLGIPGGSGVSGVGSASGALGAMAQPGQGGQSLGPSWGGATIKPLGPGQGPPSMGGPPGMGAGQQPGGPSMRGPGYGQPGPGGWSRPEASRSPRSCCSTICTGSMRLAMASSLSSSRRRAALARCCW